MIYVVGSMVADEQTKLWWVMMLVNEVCVVHEENIYYDGWCIMHCWILKQWRNKWESIWQQVLTSCWWRIYDDYVAELIRGCWCRINDDDVVVVELWLLSVMTNLWWWWWWWWRRRAGKKAAAYKSQISKIFMIHDGSSFVAAYWIPKITKKSSKNEDEDSGEETGAWKDEDDNWWRRKMKNRKSKQKKRKMMMEILA